MVSVVRPWNTRLMVRWINRSVCSRGSTYAVGEQLRPEQDSSYANASHTCKARYTRLHLQRPQLQAWCVPTLSIAHVPC